MVEFVKSKKNYFYKILKNGKKIRVSKSVFDKKNKSKKNKKGKIYKMKGGATPAEGPFDNNYDFSKYLENFNTKIVTKGLLGKEFLLTKMVDGRETTELLGKILHYGSGTHESEYVDQGRTRTQGVEKARLVEPSYYIQFKNGKIYSHDPNMYKEFVRIVPKVYAAPAPGPLVKEVN